MDKVGQAVAYVKSKPLAILTVVLLIVIIVLIVVYNTNEKFSNAIDGLIKRTPDIKELDVVMYMSPSCPHCREQVEILNKAGALDKLTIKDVNNKEYGEEASKLGVPGLPFFVSMKNQTAALGVQESVQKLAENLKTPTGEVKQQQDIPQESVDIEVVVLTRNGCSWCSKAKEDIGSKNPRGVAILDIDSDGGKAVMKSIGLEKTGVPLYFDFLKHKNDPSSKPSYTTGFAPIEKILDDFRKNR